MSRVLGAAASLFALCFAVLSSACGPKGSPPPAGCAAGAIVCGGACVDPTDDAANCGGCGSACGAGASCLSGLCAPPCAAPNQICGIRAADGGSSATLICANTATDRANCGACGNACPVNQACVNGACGACAAGSLLCPSASGDSNGACVDVTSNPASCGGCGIACANAEVCAAGECQPCPGAVCNNRCTDLQHDARDCGACGVTCSATQGCVDGACKAPVAIAFLPPLSTGKVAFESTSVAVAVESALPLSLVVALIDTSLADGGVATQDAGPLSFDDSKSDSPTGAPRSVWTACCFTVPDGGVVRVTAEDVAFRPGAGDSALHRAEVSSGPLQALSPPTGVTNIAVLAADGGALPQGTWVGLNSGPLTLVASNLPAGTRTVRFVNQGLNGATVATAALDGGTARATVAPAELEGVDGVTTLVACPVDAVGQSEPASSCTDGGVNSQVSLAIGRVPADGGVMPVVTRTDGGVTSIFYAGPNLSPAAAPTAEIFNVATTAVGSLPDSPVTPGPYLTSSLQALPYDAASVVAIRANGSGVDRFECAVAGVCFFQGYVNAPLGGPRIARIAALTSKVALFELVGGGYAYATNFFGPGAGPTAAFATVIPNASPLTGGDTLNCYGCNLATVASGAIIVWAQTSTGFQLLAVHPTAGVLPMGPQIATQPIAMQVFPTGAFIGRYPSASARGVQSVFAAILDETKGAPQVRFSDPVDVGTNSNGQFAEARAQVLVGVEAKVDPSFVLRQVMHVDLGLPKPVLTVPSGAPSAAVDSPVGPLVSGVAGRFGRDQFAVSDDQTKAIYVTAENSSIPGAQGASYTLWLLDLPSGKARPLYSSPWLQGPSGLTGSNELPPHFVHSAVGLTSVYQGQTRAAQPGDVRAVVWGEGYVFAQGASSAQQTFNELRLFYALPTAGDTATTPVLVDRTATMLVNVNDRSLVSALTQDTAAGTSLYFVSGQPNQTGFDLHRVPLQPSTTGTAASALVLDSVSSYQLREDTGRLLALRSDGTLYGGRLQAGQAPALSALGEGGPAGFPPFDPRYATTGTYGFTPDGDHGWMIVGVNFADAATDRLSTNTTLRILDLDGGHQNAGGQGYFVGLRVPLPDPQVPQDQLEEPPPCFLDNGKTAIGYVGLSSDFNPYASIYGARLVPSVVRKDLGIGAFEPAALGSPQGFTPFCDVSIDGTEARISMLLNNRSDLRSASGGTLTGNYLNAAVTPDLTTTTNQRTNFNFQLGSEPAAYSPFGGPYLESWEVFLSPTNDFQRSRGLFKVWGDTAANQGAPFPFIPFATVPNGGGFGTLDLRRTADNKALLVGYQSDSDWAYGIALPLPGRPLPRIDLLP